jgi:hypothetical protein
MWRRISCGRDDAGMTGGPVFSLPFVSVNASDVDEWIEGDVWACDVYGQGVMERLCLGVASAGTRTVNDESAVSSARSASRKSESSADSSSGSIEAPRSDVDVDEGEREAAGVVMDR